MSRAVPQRGQPILVLATILGGWTIMRALLWTSPFPAVSAVLGHELAQEAKPAATNRGGTRSGLAVTAHGPGATAAPAPWDVPGPLPVPFQADPANRPAAPAWLAPAESALPVADRATARMQRIDGQYRLLAEGYSSMALPPEVAAHYAASAGTSRPMRHQAVADRPLIGNATVASVRAGRWSADVWLLWRDGSGTAAAPGVASYGRSQGGAVVRYRLAEGPVRPEAYARATRTLEGPRQSEIAAGLSMRPVAALPVRLAAEARVTDSAAGREVRPAIFAVTELAPAKLPHGLRGEGYAQAGYVAGRDATAFIDGQVKVDGRLSRLGDEGEMRLGLAAWGGAQKGAARLDLGPSASLAFRIGEAQSRVAVDYRLRVAGEAQPKSGPAVTFSAGF